MQTALCHCQAVRIEVPSPPALILDCNCSICRRYGALWAYYPPGALRVASPEEHTLAYLWGERSIAFHHCRVCGCAAYMQGVGAPGKPIFGMNARLIVRLDPATPLVQIDNAHTGVFWTRSAQPARPGRHPQMPDPERWL